MKQQKASINTILKWVLIGMFPLLIFLSNLFFVRLCLVNGYSMYPTYRKFNIVLIDLLDKEYLPKDIVVFKGKDGQIYLKRLIAAGGNSVTLNGNRVYVNHVESEEPFAYYDALSRAEYIPEGEYLVPEGMWFVMGDNRLNSYDSRYESFGCISEECIIGRVIQYAKRTPSE